MQTCDKDLRAGLLPSRNAGKLRVLLALARLRFGAGPGAGARWGTALAHSQEEYGNER